MRRCESTNQAHKHFGNEYCLTLHDLLIFPLCPTGLETLVHTNTVGSQVIQHERGSKVRSVLNERKVDQTFVSLLQLPALL